MAAKGGLFGSKNKPLTAEQQKQLAQSMYLGVDPFVDKAYQTDPRTGIANALMEQGSSFKPVAGGMTEGIARALSGVAGGYIGKQQRDKAQAADLAQAGLFNQGIQQPVADALGPPPPAPPGMGAGTGDVNLGGAPGIVAPPQASMAPQIQNPIAQVAGAMGPQGAQPPAPMLAPNPPRPPVAPGASSINSSAGAVTPKPVRDASFYYKNGVVPIEGGTDRHGNFRTSPKGAVGPGQVMPGTAPEAARLAGLPFDDWKYRNDPDYNNALGQAYYKAKLDEFGGDPIKAAAAYNAGAGNVRRAVRRSRVTGKDWTAHLPAETQKYVTNFAAKTATADAVPEAAAAPQVAIPEMPEAPVAPERPKLGDRVRSTRLQIVQNMLNADGDQYNATQIRAALTPFLDKGLDEDQAAKIQRDENESQLTNAEFASQRQLYNEEAGALFKQPLEERTAAIRTRDTADAATVAHNRQLEQDRINNAADIEQERIQAEGRVNAKTGKPPPQFAVKSVIGNNSTVDKLRAAKSLVEQRKESVGARFQWTPDFVSNRMDPEGVAARAALAEITTTMIHDKTGSAQSIAEVERLRPYIPSAGDPPNVVGNKIDKLIEAIQAETDVIGESYPGIDPRANADTGGTMSDADLKAKYGI